MEDVVCRLCLSLITSDESQSLDTVSTDILKNIIPKLNLGISDNPKICQTCYKTMLRCYKFKTSCIREETKTEIKTNPDASQIDIEGPHIELYKDKCDLCSGNIDMESVSRFKLHKSNFNDMLDTCLPDWTRTRITFTCKTCLDNLLSYYKFIEDSIDVENKILNYCLILGMTEGKINIYEIYQHIVETSLCQSSMHIKEETIEMETDVVIKTEEVDIKDEEIASGSGTCSMDRHNRSSKVIKVTSDSGWQLISPLDVVCKGDSALNKPKVQEPDDIVYLCKKNLLSKFRQTNPTKATKKITPTKQRNFCYYCRTLVTNFARHVIKKHGSEPEVEKLKFLRKKSTERKRLLTQIRNKGDFLRAKTKGIIRLRKRLVRNTQILSCDTCLGFYSAKLLHRHKKRCVGKDRRAQSVKEKQSEPKAPGRNVKNQIRVDDKICPSRKVVNVRNPIRDNGKILPPQKTADTGLKVKNPVQKNVVTFPEVKNKENRRDNASKLKNVCYYCKDFVLNFARHLIRNHASESDVAKLKSLPPRSLERKQLFTRIRNKGNFLESVPKRAREAQFPDTPTLPCDNCLGFYSSKLLHRHRKRCSGKGGKAQSSGQSLLVRNNVDERLRSEVFPRMRADEVSLQAKNDRLICDLASRYFKRSSKKLAVVTSCKMRQLAKILIQLKRLAPEIQSLVQALQPKYFNLFVEATKRLAGYNPQTEVYGASSFPSAIVSLLKECCNIAIDTGQGQDVVSRTQLKAMLALFRTQWRLEVGDGNSPQKTNRKNAVSAANISQSEISANTNRTFTGTDSAKKCGRVLTPWTTRQKRIAKGFFEDHIRNCKPPRRYECDQLIEAHPDVFSNKTWVKIKVFIQNIYTNKCKNIETLLEDEQNDEFYTTGTDLGVETNMKELNAMDMFAEKRLFKKQNRVLTPWTRQQKQIAKKFFRNHIKTFKPPKKRECEELIEKYPEVFNNKNWLKIKVFIQNVYTKW